MTHIETMKQAQPVAIVTGYYGGRLTITPYNLSAILPTGLALYTAPLPRQPLTDEEIKAVIATIDPDEQYMSAALRQFARAIEAKHGIKGEMK